MREEGHTLGGCFGQNICFHCRADSLAECTFFGRGARQWGDVGLHEFVGSEIRRRTKASFVMVGEASIFVRKCNGSYSGEFRASQHPVTVRDCVSWEADLQRIANHETDAIPQTLIDEQEVFRRMRPSSSSSEGCHRSVRLVKVRSNRSRIPWLFSSQRLSQSFQTIEALEAMPSGRNCIRFEWQRCSRVLQAQCRKQWQRVKKPFFRQRRVRLLLV